MRSMGRISPSRNVMDGTFPTEVGRNASAQEAYHITSKAAKAHYNYRV